MACKDSIFVERGRGWCGIVASGSRPSWARGERQALYHRRHREDERMRRHLASRASSGPRRKAEPRADLGGYATEGDRDLFASIAEGRTVPSASYLERPLWRNRALILSLARTCEWAAKLRIYVPSQPPK